MGSRLRVAAVAYAEVVWSFKNPRRRYSEEFRLCSFFEEALDDRADLFEEFDVRLYRFALFAFDFCLHPRIRSFTARFVLCFCFQTLDLCADHCEVLAHAFEERVFLSGVAFAFELFEDRDGVGDVGWRCGSRRTREFFCERVHSLDESCRTLFEDRARRFVDSFEAVVQFVFEFGELRFVPVRSDRLASLLVILRECASRVRDLFGELCCSAHVVGCF